MFDDQVKSMGKVELHVHLEGAIKPRTLMKIARRNNIDLPASTPDEFDDWYQFTGFPHFADVYQTISSAIQKPEDLYDITVDFLEDQAAQNIFHTEATFTAQTHFLARGLPYDAQIDAIRAARDDVAVRLGTSLLLIIDIPRDWTNAEQALVTAEWVAKVHGDGLVGALGLGGYEVGFPPEDFEKAFAIAREAGVPAVVHAGETEGPASIWGALNTLNAIRIGHGVTCVHDANLVAHLREHQIPMEVCPSSNVCLKVCDDLQSHPIKDMEDAGLLVTVNSDDPPIFNTTLTDEYKLLSETFGFSYEDFKRFNMRAANASLLDDKNKQKLIKRLGYS